MAQDADGNYYYDAGTVNEQFEDWEFYEDADGNLGLLKNGNEMRIHELAHLFGGQRAPPTSDELPQGDERMLFISDGSGGNTGAGDLALARNPDGTVETTPIVDASAATWTDE